MPEEDYMVDILTKLKRIKAMVDQKNYFTINRGRQYGKTTTLVQLRKLLVDEYRVILLSFQGFDDENFKNSEKFCQEFLTSVSEYFEATGSAENWLNKEVKTFSDLSRHITKKCKGKKVVLMIDEVDQASNNRVFLNFLDILRTKFLRRKEGTDFTFHSVILVGVYDIKNIKLKMVQEGLHPLSSGEKQQNSPWNIAADFEVDLSFSPSEIAGMLQDYEVDHHTGMDVSQMAKEIYFYTNGYPVLVSRICWYLDRKLKQWNLDNVREAVRRLARETDNELFKSLSQNLENNESVRKLLYDVLILGVRRSFSVDNPSVGLAHRYSYIEEVNDQVRVSNKILEMRMMNYFISKDEEQSGVTLSHGYMAEITRGGRLNMQLCLERFLVHWQEMDTEKERKFLENQCRMIFLTYLKPFLNGVGFVFIETALMDDKRMDLVVVDQRDRFVLELKTWKGQLYNEQGVTQLLGYMEKLTVERGYLLTFDFRKQPEKFESSWRQEGKRQIFEARVF